MLLQDDRKMTEQRDDEGMGTSDIKYGDSLVYVQHMKTGMWLSYQTYETKKRGVGRVEEKKVSFKRFLTEPLRSLRNQTTQESCQRYGPADF